MVDTRGEDEARVAAMLAALCGRGHVVEARFSHRRATWHLHHADRDLSLSGAATWRGLDDPASDERRRIADWIAGQHRTGGTPRGG